MCWFEKEQKKHWRRDIKKGTQPTNYMKTLEGDKKMNKHVPLMICSCADRKSLSLSMSSVILNALSTH
jgi:hypothetical protein